MRRLDPGAQLDLVYRCCAVGGHGVTLVTLVSSRVYMIGFDRFNEIYPVHFFFINGQQPLDSDAISALIFVLYNL